METELNRAKEYLESIDTDDLKMFALDGSIKYLSDFLTDYAKQQNAHLIEQRTQNAKTIGSQWETIRELESELSEAREEIDRLKTAGKNSMLPDYEYEMLINDKGTPFEINTWIPIATDRIKDPSRIDEYIAKGLIRKRQ